MLKKYKNWIKFIVLIIISVLILYVGKIFHLDCDTIQRFLQRFSLVYASIIFVLLYCLVTFFVWFSKDIFFVAGALFFGAYLSTLLVWIAETINAFILFYLARYLGKGFVDGSLKSGYRNLSEKLSRISFLWLFLFRAAPLIPYRFLDLAAGLTSISFRRYLLAVIFGSPIKIFWVQFVLANVGLRALTKPYALAEYLLRNKILFIFSLIYPILVIFVALKLKHKD
jgi:uncharacterized membrane protein YdjX (TVP38/TMEM64 family)